MIMFLNGTVVVINLNVASSEPLKTNICKKKQNASMGRF